MTIRRGLLRLRLETDRLVRSRPLTARALGGYLEQAAYADLIGSLSQLLPSEFRALAAQDVEQLPVERSPRPMAALRLHERALGRARKRRRAATSASLAVIGTSWTGEAAERLRDRCPEATRFLEELSWRGVHELDFLSSQGSEALALAELARGTLLGVISQLEIAWPPPRITPRSWTGTEASAEVPVPAIPQDLSLGDEPSSSDETGDTP